MNIIDPEYSISKYTFLASLRKQGTAERESNQILRTFLLQLYKKYYHLAIVSTPSKHSSRLMCQTNYYENPTNPKIHSFHLRIYTRIKTNIHLNERYHFTRSKINAIERIIRRNNIFITRQQSETTYSYLHTHTHTHIVYIFYRIKTCYLSIYTTNTHTRHEECHLITT